MAEKQERHLALQRRLRENRASWPKTGRNHMALHEYEKWSAEKSKAIESEMNTFSDKNNPRYIQLRC